MLPNVGIAITSLNRRDTFNRTLDAYRRFTPPEWPILIVDDGSDIPIPGAHHRNPSPQGIAAAKNTSITLLMDIGVDHLFLSDDDVYPTADDWWEPFLGGQPHLIYQPTTNIRECRTCGTTLHIYHTIKGFFDCATCVDEVRPLHSDANLFSVQWGAGVLLYAHRTVIDRVGGLRPDFARWSCETWEWSQRIYNAGLTDHVFASPHDPPLHALDAHNTGRRSCVSDAIRNQHRERNWKLFQQFKDSDDFVPYREPRLTDNVTVCIPRRDTPDRVDAHNRCHQFWTEAGFTVVEADSDHRRPFSCSAARNNAVRKAKTDIVVIADADTVPDSIDQIATAVKMIESGQADVIFPYQVFHHIDRTWALKPEYKNAPIQQRYSESPGGIFVMRRDTLWRFGGFDERMSALGYDDTAFVYAAKTLGTVKRVPGICWSFNHRTNADGKPDRDFSEKNPNFPRFELYRAALGKPELMRELISK